MATAVVVLNLREEGRADWRGPFGRRL